MMKKHRLVIALASFIVLLGCGKESPVVIDNTTQPSYYPLSSGSWWEYTSHKDSIGEYDTLIDGSSVQTFYRFISGTTYKTYIRKLDNEIRKYIYLNDTGSYYVIFKSPLYVGLKWQAFDYNDTSHATYDSIYVVGTGTVTVPAGTFVNCYQLFRKWDNQREDPDSSESWYAPNVGSIINLVSYSIK